MTILGLVVVVAGVAAGFAIAWAWANSSAGAARLELERRAAGIDGTAQELKKSKMTRCSRNYKLSQKRIEDEQKLRAAAEKEAEGQRENLAEQRRLLDDAQIKLREAFQSLAGEALKSSSDQFMELAKAKFDSLQKRSRRRPRASQASDSIPGRSA